MILHMPIIVPTPASAVRTHTTRVDLIIRVQLQMLLQLRLIGANKAAVRTHKAVTLVGVHGLDVHPQGITPRCTEGTQFTAHHPRTHVALLVPDHVVLDLGLVLAEAAV